MQGNLELATFGAGCFWGTEKYYARDFESENPGSILGTSVGYMNENPNARPNPSYEEVCDGMTGYVEVVHVLFDSDKADFRKLCKFLFQFHDPTTLNRQGNDTGSQYKSAIFYHSEEQKKVAEEVIESLQKFMNQGKIDKFETSTVRTAVSKATKFYAGEDYHQRYLESQPWGYCNHKIRFKWDIIE